MSANYRASLSTTAPVIDDSVSRSLRSMRDRLWRFSAYFPTNHSACYWRKQLADDPLRQMSLRSFVAFLRITHWIGEQIFGGKGQQWVIQILQPIAEEFGLEVQPKGQRVETTKPAQEELLEFAVASADLTSTVNRVLGDGICTPTEADEIQKLQQVVSTEAEQLAHAAVKR